MIESITRRYGSTDLAKTVFIEDGNNLFYRSELKRQVKETIKSGLHSFHISEEVISLNTKE